MNTHYVKTGFACITKPREYVCGIPEFSVISLSTCAALFVGENSNQIETHQNKGLFFLRERKTGVPGKNTGN